MDIQGKICFRSLLRSKIKNSYPSRTRRKKATKKALFKSTRYLSPFYLNIHRDLSNLLKEIPVHTAQFYKTLTELREVKSRIQEAKRRNNGVKADFIILEESRKLARIIPIVPPEERERIEESN